MRYLLPILLLICFSANAQTNNVIQKFQTGGSYIDAHITDNGTIETHTLPMLSSAPGGASYQSNYSGTSTTFYTSYLNYGLMSINRNPITGTYGNVNLASMEFRLTAANGSAGLSVLGTNTNNAAQSLLFDIDGVGLATFHGNAKFASNGTAATGKIPVATDANGNWTWQTAPSGAAPGNPTVTLGTGAGTGATYILNGNDRSGVIQVTTGTAPVIGGTVATITYGISGAGRTVVLSAGSGPTPAVGYLGTTIGSVVGQSCGSTCWAVTNNGYAALAPGFTYSWNYFVGQ